MLCALSRLIAWCQGHERRVWLAQQRLGCSSRPEQRRSVPQELTQEHSLNADNRSIAWLALGLAQAGGDEAHGAAVQLAAALWALRRKDGTLAIRSGQGATGDNLPAVLDADDSSWPPPQPVYYLKNWPPPTRYGESAWTALLPPIARF